MIVSRVKLEFPEAPWSAEGKAKESVRRVFEHVVGKSHNEAAGATALEQMSLGELLYFALAGESAKV